MDLEQELGLGTSMLGSPLSEGIKGRLRAAVETPCASTWDNAYTIILNGGVGLGLTLWQAVLMVDPEFGSAQGPVTRWVEDATREHGGYSVPVSGWTRTPAADVIRQAIAYATH
jgi:hypothetical protein